MVSAAQRIEALRTEKNISRIQLSAELGFPKTAIEKFETGRQTPTKEQFEKMARYFGVSSAYLKCESDDRQNLQQSWLSGNVPDDEPARPAPVSVQAKLVAQSGKQEKEDNAVFNLLLKSDAFKSAVLEVLKTPEGQELIRKAMKKL